MDSKPQNLRLFDVFLSSRAKVAILDEFCWFVYKSKCYQIEKEFIEQEFFKNAKHEHFMAKIEPLIEKQQKQFILFKAFSETLKKGFSSFRYFQPLKIQYVRFIIIAAKRISCKK